MSDTDTANAPFVVLVADDDPALLSVLEARLLSAGYEAHAVQSGEEALDLLAAEPVDLLLTDVKMEGMSGLELFEKARAQYPDLPVVLLTAHGRIPDAVETIRRGAADYLTKPFEGRELLRKLAAILAGRVPRAVQAAGSDLREILWGGQSPSMRRLYARLARVSGSDVSALITGESGTGKGVIAAAIHRLSARRDGPLVVVDCGSTPQNLLESELFGHVKGSFTHAVRDKKGLIQEAHGGTLFLDEIGNISHEMQTRLLRFLEERTIRRIGDTRETRVDCRVIAATNADLAALVRDGAFREDLYFRLKVVTLHVPPLRQRREDIPILAEKFVEKFSQEHHIPKPRLARETLACMLEYPWPGNVRELKHAIEAALVMGGGDVILPDDLALEDQGEYCVDLPSLAPNGHAAAPVAGQPQGQGGAEPLNLEENERQAIIRALEAANWVQKDAADLLGISRRAIHYKVKKYEIVIPGRGVRD